MVFVLLGNLIKLTWDSSILCSAGVWLWTDIRRYGGSEWTEQKLSFHGTIYV